VVHMGFFQKERFHFWDFFVLNTTLLKRCLIIIWHCKYVNTFSYLVHSPLIVEISTHVCWPLLSKCFHTIFVVKIFLIGWDLYRYSFAIEMIYDVFYVFVNLWHLYIYMYDCMNISVHYFPCVTTFEACHNVIFSQFF
jgi:hypothetical protein